MLDIANGCAATGIQSEESFVSQFRRKASFRQLYELILNSISSTFIVKTLHMLHVYARFVRMQSSLRRV